MTTHRDIPETCEIRECPFTGRRVIFSTKRMGRPYEFVAQSPCRKDIPCPFCPGNESETPPEVRAERPGNSQPNSPDWSLRIIPNKFPALLKNQQPSVAIDNSLFCIPGIGIHEVVIETNVHDLSFSNFSVELLTMVLKYWRDRFNELSTASPAAYIQLFKNSGALGGASIQHAHSQILTLPIIPEFVANEIDRAARHYKANGICIFCKTIKDSMKPGAPRFVSSNDHFLTLTPFASLYPYETWLFPKIHQPSFKDVDDACLPSLAQALADLFYRYHEIMGAEFPFNLVLHTAPVSHADKESYHWHFELYPQVAKIAGFERSTGVYINAIPPEYAARQLHL